MDVLLPPFSTATTLALFPIILITIIPILAVLLAIPLQLSRTAITRVTSILLILQIIPMLAESVVISITITQTLYVQSIATMLVLCFLEKIKAVFVYTVAQQPTATISIPVAKTFLMVVVLKKQNRK